MPKINWMQRITKSMQGHVPSLDDNDHADFGKMSQWASSDGVRFFPSGKIWEFLPPGVYEIQMTQTKGIMYEKVPVKTEGLVRFPETNSEKVIAEIQSFWEKEAHFKQFDLAYKRGIILYGPPGCHAPGTKILMYDGSSKNVEYIRIGDKLMGPDFQPRIVLELCAGKDEMYRIFPTRGEPFVVNGHHILSLCRRDKTVENITVNEYLKLKKQQLFKLRKVILNKSSLYYGIKHIEHLGRGQYFGFNLSGDHLYLTNDFFVHHNTGKSCTIQLVMADVIDRGGVVFKFNVYPEVFIEGVRQFREIQPNTPLVVLIEDIDSIIEMYSESEVLQILDGVDNIERVVFVATTNFPENLGGRILNRPSRFDKRFKMPPPKKSSRRLYFDALLDTKTIQDYGIDVEKWVNDTDEMSIAHLKELFIAVVILGNPYEEAISNLRTMNEERAKVEDDEFGFMPKKGK